jgi:hypothetical protein
MNEWQLENKDIYNRLLTEFKPIQRKSKDGSNRPEDADTIIGVRIRPILLHEAELGHVPGVCARKGGSPVVDIHEFREHVRRKPALDVGC